MRKKRSKDVLTLALASQVLVIVSGMLTLLVRADGWSIMVWLMITASVVLCIHLAGKIRENSE